MLIGQNVHTIDEKCRIVMPSSYREELGEKIYLTKDPLENAILGYNAKEWSVMAEKISSYSLLDGSVIQRSILGNAVEASIDKQGRMVIPPSLREKVMLDREIVIVGAVKRIEIWNFKDWQALQGSVTKEQMLKAMSETGF